MKYLIILVSIVFIGCGSRKVELQKRINDIETNLNLTIRELEVERSKIRIYESTRISKADSIVEKDGKRTIYNPSSEEKEKGKEESVEKQKTKEEDIVETVKDKSQEKIKVVKREQFNWWPIIIISSIILILVYFFKDKIGRIIKRLLL